VAKRNGRNGSNGRPKRGPGRPPGPCATPYRRSGAGPLHIGASHIVGVPEPPVQFDLTRREERQIRAYALTVDLSRATLLDRARSGDGEARAALRDRWGLTLPLVEAAAAGLPASAVLSGTVDARSLVTLGETRAAWGPGSPWEKR